MIMLDICLLGCGGMLPLPERYLTSLLISSNGKMLMIDCGEGTQVTMKMAGWGFKALNAICFTHYHADHISGLPGMLLTIGNSGKTEPLTLIGPEGLADIVKGLLVIAPNLPYNIRIIELSSTKKENVEAAGFSIESLPVEHGMPCLAYSVYLKRIRKFDLARAESTMVPKMFWNKLQKGENIEYEGRLYTPDMVLGADRKGIKLTYCTDSRPVESLIDFVSGADLFVCEGMYGSDDMISKALEYKHMLFSEAATLASKAAVKELWLTHYSPSIVNADMYTENTRKIFENTHLGFDRKKTTLNFIDE